MLDRFASGDAESCVQEVRGAALQFGVGRPVGAHAPDFARAIRREDLLGDIPPEVEKELLIPLAARGGTPDFSQQSALSRQFSQLLGQPLSVIRIQFVAGPVVQSVFFLLGLLYGLDLILSWQPIRNPSVSIACL